MTKGTQNVVGMMAVKTGVTLYMEDGSLVDLKSGDWQTKRIIEQVTPALSRGETAQIDLGGFGPEKMIEEKTGGVLSFIRRKIFGKPDAVVAVVNGIEIKGVQKLAAHIENAVFTGNTKGIENLMLRMSLMTEKRGHAVQDLLSFLNKSDLPIADNGSILAYKALSTTATEGVFVDVHTQKVRQRMGSKVQMPSALVDDNRRKECSTGLHIARRDYLGNFRSDVIVLVSINPEDVIAVPHGDPSKIRVSAYHIIGLLNSEAEQCLRRNKSMTEADPASALTLASAIKGDHVEILERVTINGPRGSDVRYEISRFGRKRGLTPYELKVKSIDPVQSIDVVAYDTPIDVKALNLQAAMSGDLSAALTTSVPVAPPSMPDDVKPVSAPDTAALTPPAPSVSTRDAEILERLGLGQSQRHISEEMKVCAKTIRKIQNLHVFGR